MGKLKLDIDAVFDMLQYLTTQKNAEHLLMSTNLLHVASHSRFKRIQLYFAYRNFASKTEAKLPTSVFERKRFLESKLFVIWNVDEPPP